MFPTPDEESEEMANWTAGLYLRLINSEKTSTCVHRQEEAIADFSWASPLTIT